ncbi:hypothetical protein [Hyalangium gracile]|uniref:hypothetical protein n=1 Tax=Hyalangium gracile TaxID=394092 RepID=UPI001CCEBAB1|nr:hypothetical protein [Hyalangium gracile]
MRSIAMLLCLLWSLAAQAQQTMELAQAPCTSTYDCCLMRNPGTPQVCGGRIGATNTEGTAALATAVDGKALASQLAHMAAHLARLLALSEVGGVPPGEPPNKDTDKHWWTEIKASLKNVKHLLKNARSRRQVLAELRKDGRFSEQQVADLEARLAEAAKKMGDDTPMNLLPRE